MTTKTLNAIVLLFNVEASVKSNAHRKGLCLSRLMCLSLKSNPQAIRIKAACMTSEQSSHPHSKEKSNFSLYATTGDLEKTVEVLDATPKSLFRRPCNCKAEQLLGSLLSPFRRLWLSRTNDVSSRTNRAERTEMGTQVFGFLRIIIR